uniref:Retrovirus-related Pol polyprotein from transposon TNT 1-94 n=1 Tax=Cajanus cajan TaxID=3821 RepID=A0A151SB05_CAJCA|nr:hypothetical protein KK1_026196 [Cajanus cajan]
MKENESIQTMFGRFQVTALRASKDLEKLSLEELVGLLKVHEMDLQQDKAGRKQKSIALSVQKTKPTSSSSKALKAEEASDESCEEETCESDDEISLLFRKIYSMMKKKGGSCWKSTTELQEKRHNHCAMNARNLDTTKQNVQS